MSVNEEEGIIAVILQRFNHERLPRALELKAMVDRGECLDDRDLDFLQTMHDASRDAQPYVERHKELQDIYARAVALHSEIIAKALANEEKVKK